MVKDVMQCPKTEIRSIPRPRCLLCETEGKMRYLDLRDPFFCAPGKWLLKQCPRPECALMWLDPVPVPEDVHLAYQQSFPQVDHDINPTLASVFRNIMDAACLPLTVLPENVFGPQKAKSGMSLIFLDDLAPAKV